MPATQLTFSFPLPPSPPDLDVALLPAGSFLIRSFGHRTTERLHAGAALHRAIQEVIDLWEWKAERITAGWTFLL